MATEEHLIIQKVEGEDRVRKLTSAIQANEAALAAQIATLRAQGTANVAADATVARLTAAIRAQSDELAGVQGALGRTNKALGNGSQGLLAFARTLDDAKQFQVGFSQGMNAISNNLTEISPLLGVAAVAVGVLSTHWEEFQDRIKGTALQGALEGGITSIDELSGAFRALGEAIGIAKGKADELAEAGKKASEATAKITGSEQEERGRRFTATIKEQGGGTAVEQELFRRSQEQAPIATPEGRQLREGLLSQLFAKAQTGEEGSVNRVMEIMGPQSGFAQAFQQASPESQAQVKALEDQNKATADAARANNETLDKADEAANKAHAARLKERVDEAVKILAKEPTIVAAAGAKPGILETRIRNRLVGSGAYGDDREATEVAYGAAARVRGDAADEARKRALGGAPALEGATVAHAALQTERVRSEFISATDISRRAQTAALSGGADGKEMTDLQKKANEHLEAIAKNTKGGGNGGAVFGP